MTPLPQANGKIKNRPALVLREMPNYGDLPVCGISTQLRQAIADFDDAIRRSDPDFAASGLPADSVFRLGFLAVIPRSHVPGIIGTIGEDRRERLLRRLGEYIMAHAKRRT